ncbi:MAG TPA: TonB-dependent receptor [Chitinispirillaceae bacterium]|jgi:outer membrane cobalamin receptor|nr:TonB-dependent receptor [Chitinispirillaceae bacterium]
MDTKPFRYLKSIPAISASCLLFSVLSALHAGESSSPGEASDSLSRSSSLHDLDKMTVRGQKPLTKAAVSERVVVEGKQIRETARSTPLEELSQKSGSVYITSRGTGLHGISSGASGGIYIRGMGGSPNSQILVVEDGAPDYQGIFGHPIPDAFFPSMIDKVTVIKGGDGVLYGTNAMGVIDIRNRWPEKGGICLENNVAVGSFNTFRENLSIFYRKNRIDAVTAISAFTTDGHRDGAGGNSLAGSVAIKTRLSEKSTISFRDRLIHLEGNDPGTVISPYTDHFFEVLRNSFSAQFKHDRSSVSLSFVPWINTGEHKLYDGFFSRDYTAGGSAEVTLSGKWIETIAGMSGEYIDGTVQDRLSNTFSPVKSQSISALYGQVALETDMDLSGLAGARVLYSSRYGTVFLYKASLHWNPLEPLSFHSRIAKNFRIPTLRELYLPFPVANPDLRPELSLNWDAGMEIKAENLKAGCSVFKTWGKDMIRYFGMWPSAEVVNIGRLEIQGIEAEISIDNIGPLMAYITACWQNAGFYTKQNPGSKVNTGITYSSPINSSVLEVTLSSEWVHDLYMNNYKRDPVKDIFFIDGSMRLRIYRSGSVVIEPYCMIRNLLNSQYEYIKYYPMPGLNFLCGLSIKV